MNDMAAPVIVAFIPSPLGHATVHAGIEEARRRATTLLLLHSIADRTDAERAALEEQEMAAVERSLTNAAISHEVRLIDHSESAAEDIVRVAGEVSAQLVVIGIRPHSAISLLFGRNALEILRNCPCPVLSVRNDPAA